MRVRTFLREIREGRGHSLREATELTGLAGAELSRIERGQMLPTDRQAEAMPPAYGQGGWYPFTVAAVLVPDTRRCLGCRELLPPAAVPRQMYHDEKCRSRYRRRSAAESATSGDAR